MKPQTFCWGLSLFSLGGALLALGLSVCNKRLEHTGLVTLSFSALCALAAAIALPLELISLAYKRRDQWPSRSRMALSIPVWLLAVGVMILARSLFFVESSRRSTVQRVKADQRTVAVAIESYYLDTKSYPGWSLDQTQNAHGLRLQGSGNALQKIPTFRVRYGNQALSLTTPVAYLSADIPDFFAPVKGASFAYWTNVDAQRTTATGYIIWSPGPDGGYDITIDNVARLYDPAGPVPSSALLNLTYDPSNGTQSAGDIYRTKQ